MHDIRWARRFLAGLALLATSWHAGTAGASDESFEQSARMALPLTTDIANGKSLFGRHCRGCHRADARGDGGLGIPTLAGQRFGYLVLQLAAFADGQRDSYAMHRVMSESPMLRPQAWVDVAAYLCQMPPARAVQRGPGRRLSPGGKLFREQCVACHHPDARGDDENFVPSLRSQHYSYLSNQIVRLAEGHRHNLDEKLVRLLQELNGSEIEGVADYLSRLRPSP